MKILFFMIFSLLFFDCTRYVKKESIDSSVVPKLIKNEETEKCNKVISLQCKILIDTNGIIRKVLSNDLPQIGDSIIIRNLKRYSFKPAVINKTKVATWLTTKIDICKD